jgi:hypothetical protein
VKAEQRRQAEGAVAVLFRNLGRHTVHVPPRSRLDKPLRDAERLGLTWWPAPDRCALTDAGAKLAAQYRGEGGGDGD